MVMKIKGYCNKPDRDSPETICGYPIPCPWHTVLIDISPNPPTVTIPVTFPEAANPKILRKLKKIAQILKEV